MTDRVIAFTVGLEKEMRIDDAEPIMAAIRQLRCVASVDPVIADPMMHVIKSQVRQEFSQAIFDVMYPKVVMPK